MDQEGVTHVHVTGGTGCTHLATSRCREWDLGVLSRVGTGQALFAGGSEQLRHLEMRAREQAARRVVHPHVGDQAQQQQRPLSRSVVHEPAGVARWLEARIDVPPGVPRILGAGESHDERPQVRARLPGIGRDQLTDRVEQARRVGCAPEAIPRRHTSDHRPSPGVRAREIDAQLLGRRATALLGQLRRKGGTDHEIALSDELIDVERVRHPTILLPEGDSAGCAVDRYAGNRRTTDSRISSPLRLSSESSCGSRNSAANEAISARSHRMA